MKVLFEAETTDYGTSIEKAKAIIDAVMCNDSYHDEEYRAQCLKDLNEIKDYIDVYLKHNGDRVEERWIRVCQKS